MQSVLQRLLYAMNYSSMNSKSNEKMRVIVLSFYMFSMRGTTFCIKVAPFALYNK